MGWNPGSPIYYSGEFEHVNLLRSIFTICALLDIDIFAKTYVKILGIESSWSL